MPRTILTSKIPEFYTNNLAVTWARGDLFPELGKSADHLAVDNNDDDYVLVTANEQLPTRNMSNYDLQRLCLKVLAEHGHHPREPCHVCDALFRGLDHMQDISGIWADMSPAKEKPFRILKNNIKVRIQFDPHGIFEVLQALAGSADWMTFDRMAVENEEFEISPLIWAYKLGSEALGRGWAAGKTFMEILLAAEEDWISEHATDEKFEVMKEMLKQVAEELRMWGRKIVAQLSAQKKAKMSKDAQE